MALKDWKKHGKNEWINNHKILAIDYERVWRHYPVKRWKVSTSDNRFYAYRLLMSFKTKSQALEFAKQYMRKH